MGTHLYDCLNSFERMLEGHQELSKEVLKKFGGHAQCNRCKILPFSKLPIGGDCSFILLISILSHDDRILY